MQVDVVVVGAGLAGLVATRELALRGTSVALVDQEPESNLGGQAWWSFGGLFMVDSPEQRRLGVHDSPDLAWRDWRSTAGFDRPEDYWARQWAEAYVHFAHQEKRAWLHDLGHRLFPVVGWAERGDGRADGPGNSVPRFHVTWGTGPALVAPFADAVRDHARQGSVRLLPRHRVDELVMTDGRVTGVRGATLAASTAARGEPSSRDVVGDFEITAEAVLVSSGGIGGDLDLVRAAWPERLGPPPARMVVGVPAHVDGRMIGISERAGGRVVNRDRMWHYVEGISNWAPIWKDHGIRILPGPSSLWLDATGQRLPAPYFPGFDTLGTLAHLRSTGHDHSWLLLNRTIAGKEFTLSGSEQNLDLTDKSVRGVLSRATSGMPPSVQAFLDHGADFVTATSIEDLVPQMNALTETPLLDAAAIRALVEARDAQLDNRFGKDAQLAAIRGARAYAGDRLVRVAPPHRLLDPAHGPLVAVRLSILSRKTLGGLETDLSGRVLGLGGEPVSGLYAAGEASGFGGGGVHGYRSLEGTFLGGCLFTGRTAGRAIADALA